MPRNPHFDAPPEDGAVWMGQPRDVPATLRTAATLAEPQPPKETVGDNVPPTGWMHRSDDGEQLRAAHAAAVARRHEALSTGSTFVPRPPPQQPPTGWMHRSDDGQVARMYADRQNRLNPTILGQPLTFPSSSPEPPGWVGQPQAMPKTLLGAALEAASNPNPAAGQPVTFVNDKGESVTFVNNDGQPVTFVNDKGAPRDEFAEAAAEAERNPDPAVEREIFDYGTKDIEPPVDGVSTVRVGGQSAGGAFGTATFGNARTIERNLSERPADIRDAARALVKEIRDQVEQLKNSKPNDEEGLAKHNEFVEFLERIAAGLAELADALDQAVNASLDGPPEPIFLGKAARIAEQLNLGMMEWLEANRANVAGCTLRIGLIGAGYLFLNACGLSGNIAAIVSGLVNRGFSNKKTSTARAKKTNTTRAKKRPTQP
jgi:hypothetical protein